MVLRIVTPRAISAAIGLMTMATIRALMLHSALGKLCLMIATAIAFAILFPQAGLTLHENVRFIPFPAAK